MARLWVISVMGAYSAPTFILPEQVVLDYTGMRGLLTHFSQQQPGYEARTSLMSEHDEVLMELHSTLQSHNCDISEPCDGIVFENGFHIGGQNYSAVVCNPDEESCMMVSAAMIPNGPDQRWDRILIRPSPQHPSHPSPARRLRDFNEWGEEIMQAGAAAAVGDPDWFICDKTGQGLDVFGKVWWWEAAASGRYVDRRFMCATGFGGGPWPDARNAAALWDLGTCDTNPCHVDPHKMQVCDSRSTLYYRQMTDWCVFWNENPATTPPLPMAAGNLNCISGSVDFTDNQGRLTPVSDLSVGDVVTGLDWNRSPALCRVAQIFYEGLGVAHGKYTRGHHMVSEHGSQIHGTAHEAEVVPLYHVFSDNCSAFTDSEGLHPTMVSDHICDVSSLSWSDVTFITKTMISAQKKLGYSLTDPGSYANINWATVQKICNDAVQCGRDGQCDEFERSSGGFVENNMSPHMQQRMKEEFTDNTGAGLAAFVRPSLV